MDIYEVMDDQYDLHETHHHLEVHLLLLVLHPGARSASKLKMRGREKSRF